MTRTVKAVLVGRKVGYVERCADACEAVVVLRFKRGRAARRDGASLEEGGL